MKTLIGFLFTALGLVSTAAATDTALSIVGGTTTLTSCSNNITIQGEFTSSDPLFGVSSVRVMPVQLASDNVPVHVTCPDVNNKPTGIVTVVSQSGNQATLDAVTLLGGVQACGPNGAHGFLRICIYYSGGIAGHTFQYNTEPNNITIDSLSVGNERITVNIADPKSGTTNDNPTYQVCYGAAQADIAALTNTTGACPLGDKTPENTSKNITVTGLANGTTYWVVARVKGSSNQWSASKSETPELTYGFGKVYDGAPNRLSFSCTQTSAGPGTWMLFLLLGIFLRFKGGNKSVFIAVLLLGSLPVLADLGQVNFGIIGSTYKPNLDGSTKADGSQARQFYGTMFSDNLLPLMGIEVDIHLLDDFGSLQLGVGLQYAYASGSALKVEPNGTLTNNRSSDSVELNMLHLKPQLTYILDPWIDTVPLAPYVRGGIVALGYMFRYQGGIDREPGGVNPMGLMFGWEAAAGLMLALDWMEPSVSKAARANGTYDHIYLKAEAAYMPINNFHQNGLNFSPAWPKQDLPLMLTFGLVFEFK